MGHHHDHHHHSDPRSARAQNRTRLSWILAMTITYMVAEIVGGYYSDSLALLADAGHMFSDAAALGLSLFAAWISQHPPTPQHSYGYYRAEILAALFNGATLIAIALVIFYEAFHRFREPAPVEGELMLGIAVGGLVVNVLGLAILNAGRTENLNVHGAWLHLLTDALGSVAAIAAAGLIWAFAWYWADPAASILIGLLVIYSSWDLVKQAIAILMESTPSRLNIDAVSGAMMAAPGVCGVHDLHVWTITSGMESLSAHVVLRPGYEASAALDSLRKVLHDQFAIDHITIQIEWTGEDKCGTAF